MRLVLAALLVVGCGGSPPGAGGDAPLGGDGGADAGGADAGMDAPGTMPDGPPASSCPNWCVETAPVAATARLFSVHVRDSADVLAVGDGGVIIRRQNDVWTAMQSTTTENLRGVWAASANDAWAVGNSGLLSH